MCPSLLCACKPRRGDGTVIFSAANHLGTSSERGKGGTRLVAGDVTGAFLICHPQRRSVAGERVGSVDAPGPVNHGQRGKATN